MKTVLKSVSIVLCVLVFQTAFAQDKSLSYYYNHPDELLPDARLAFVEGGYERAVQLCNWYYIIEGKHDSALEEKVTRCAKLSLEMKEYESAGNLRAAAGLAGEILLLNPDDKYARELRGSVVLADVVLFSYNPGADVGEVVQKSVEKPDIPTFLKQQVVSNVKPADVEKIEMSVYASTDDGTAKANREARESLATLIKDCLRQSGFSTSQIVTSFAERAPLLGDTKLQVLMTIHPRPRQSKPSSASNVTTGTSVTNASNASGAARMGYMMITSVSFANTDIGRKVVTDYGSPLYRDEVMFLTPKVDYDGMAAENKTVALDIKIYGPDGTMRKGGASSPAGYTYSSRVTVTPGVSQSIILPGWGKKEAGASYTAGRYKFEIWCQGNRLVSTAFDIVEKPNALSKGAWLGLMMKSMDNVSYKYENGAYKGQVDGGRNGMGVYKWNNAYYWGQWSDGQRDGIGIYFVTDETRQVGDCADCTYYVGAFSNNEIVGKGICYDKYGNLLYYGELSSSSPTGPYPTTGYRSYKFECIEYEGGDMYVGETKGGMRDGEGIYLWTNGDAWFGQWDHGQRKGEGLLLEYSGSVIHGQWEGDKLLTDE